MKRGKGGEQGRSFNESGGGALRTGRPGKNEPAREELTKITFKADAETVKALDALVRDAKVATRALRGRSAVLRKMIIEAAARITPIADEGA